MSAFGGAIPCQAKTIYVDDDANGLNNGSNWANAYKYLQDALSDANSSVKPVEIRVAQGIYNPDHGVGITPGDREATFQLINGVTLKGGYADPRMFLSGADPNERDIKLYETILSGDLDGNDIEVSDPRDLLNEPTRAENSYHVVTGTGTNATAVLDGFTVTAGNADAPYPSPPLHGGGMYDNSGSPTVTNCIFIGNSADGDGGGLFNCNGTIKNNLISFNSARGHGGGLVYCHGIIQNNLIFNNWANEGGGIAICNGTIQNNTIFGNSASEDGGGLYECSAAVFNCIIWGNTAMSDGSQFWGCSNVTWSCIEDWTESGEGNISADPCFADPNNGDYHLKSQAGRWDANEGRWTKDDVTSPCIDAGDPASPIGLEPFPNGGIINMGAYGGTEEASKSYFGEPVCETIIAGDINGDCIIDFKDFTLMALHWLECIGPNRGGLRLVEDDTEDSYSCEGNFDIFYPCSNAVDEDWNTYVLPADPGATSYICENYIIPSGIAMADFRIKYQQTAPVTPGLCTTVTDYWDGSTWTELNCTALSSQISTLTVRIPHDALSRTTLQLRTRVWKSSGIIGSGSGMYYEGKVIWYFLPDCETIVAGDINGDCVVNFKDFALMAFHWLEEH